MYSIYTVWRVNIYEAFIASSAKHEAAERRMNCDYGRKKSLK